MAVPSRALSPDMSASLVYLRALEQKVLWLSSWMIHHANHGRPSRDGLKVGGHQASCASVATLMTALYFHVLRPQDRVAVKPHASPIFHAIQYLFGRQSRERLMRKFKSPGQAQRFLALHDRMQNLFRLGRHLTRAVTFRILRDRAFAEWQQVTYA